MTDMMTDRSKMDDDDEDDDDFITLVAEGRSFSCQKAKLIAASDYFRAMFSSNFTEHAKSIVELQGIDADCLQLLLQYAESGIQVIPTDSKLALLQTSAMLQFISVQEACEQEVLSSLTCDSCLEVYFVTSTLGLVHVSTAALTVAVWKFPEIAKKPNFLQLSLNDLVEYVSHPALCVGPGGEWTVWEALVNWIEENEIERACHLPQLLHCLDFHSLTQEDISIMLFYSVVSENDTVVRVLEAIKKIKINLAAKRTENNKAEELRELKLTGVSDGPSSESTEEEEEVSAATERTMNRTKRKLPQVPCVVGFKPSPTSLRKQKAKNSDDEGDQNHVVFTRIKDLEVIPVVYSFNPVTKKMSEEIVLRKLCEGPVQCSGYQVCSVGPSVYILGGEFQLGHGNWNKSFWRYSTASRKWIIEEPLPQPRRHNMVCVIDSIIYILGGFGRHRVVQSSVDAYDTESGEWLRCPDMPHCVSHGAVCALNGRLMVFTQEMQLLTYYPSQRKWSAIPLRSPTRQGYRAALTWKNCVYLIDNCTSKVYKWSPEEGHIITYFGHFTTQPVNVCVVDGKIYSFSHDDLDDSHVIEVLDISEESDRSPANYTEASIKEPSTREDQDECQGRNVIAKEVWRENDAGTHLFTTKCPADNTFSHGCFPLFKLSQ